MCAMERRWELQRPQIKNQQFTYEIYVIWAVVQYFETRYIELRTNNRTMKFVLWYFGTRFIDNL